MGARDEDRRELHRLIDDLNGLAGVDTVARRFFRSLSSVFRSEKPDGELPNLAENQERGAFWVSFRPAPVASQQVQDRAAPWLRSRHREGESAGASQASGDVMDALGALARSGRAAAPAAGDSVRPTDTGVDRYGSTILHPNDFRRRPDRAGALGDDGVANSRSARIVPGPREAGGSIRQRVLDRVSNLDLNRLGGEAPPRQNQGASMDTATATPIPVNDPGLAGTAAVAAALAPETAAAENRTVAGNASPADARAAALNPGQFPGAASIVHRASAAMADVHGHTLNVLNNLKTEIDALINAVESHRERATAELSAFVASADNALRHADAIKKSLGVISETIE